MKYISIDNKKYYKFNFFQFFSFISIVVFPCLFLVILVSSSDKVPDNNVYISTLLSFLAITISLVAFFENSVKNESDREEKLKNQLMLIKKLSFKKNKIKLKNMSGSNIYNYSLISLRVLFSEDNSVHNRNFVEKDNFDIIRLSEKLSVDAKNIIVEYTVVVYNIDKAVAFEVKQPMIRKSDYYVSDTKGNTEISVSTYHRILSY